MVFNEISLNTMNMHCLQVSIVSCICFLFIVVNCKLVYDLKMAKHGRNMSSSTNQLIRSYDSCVLTDPPNLICIKNTTGMRNLKIP